MVLILEVLLWRIFEKNQTKRLYLSRHLRKLLQPRKKKLLVNATNLWGSIQALIESGIEDPIAHFQKEVDYLNKRKKEAGVRKISINLRCVIWVISP